MGLRERLQQLALDSVVVAGDAARTGARAYGDLLRRVDVGVGPVRLTPEGAAHVRDVLLQQLREALDIPDVAAALGTGDERVGSRGPDPAAVARALLELQPRLVRDLVSGENGMSEEEARRTSRRLTSAEQLRDRVQALLDPATEEVELYPAMVSIVAQLSPDQARMLRHLHLEGAAPAVDVVAVPRFALNTTTGRLVAQSLNVLTDRSGGDDAVRGPAHLHNLIRLGLVAIEDRELPDHGDYQLIEAGKVYTSVMRSVTEDQGLRARTVRQTVRLTPLGQELCRLALTPALETPGPADPPGPDPEEGVPR